jgi:cell division protein FtsI/penicillin-binding protein 2
VTKRRLLALALVLLAAFVGLGYRLVDLQVIKHEELLREAQANTQRIFFREPRRGDIRDIRGNLLATSRLVKTVCADPCYICNTNIGNRQVEMARLLSPLLQMPEIDLVRLLQLRILTNKAGKLIPDRYVVLKRKVRVEDWDAITNALARASFGLSKRTLSRKTSPHFDALRTKAIFAENDQLREYPNRQQAAHVVGYVGLDEHNTPRGKAIEISGKDGVEYTLDSQLTGVRGWRLTEQSEGGKELVAFREQDVAPCAGLNAVLTLDLGLQNIVESELADAMQKHHPISASSMIVRPRTGEVLAMATLPNFDPNQPGASPPEFRRNRVVTDLSEPGSTFKIVVVTAALNEHLVSLSDTFYCEQGHFYYAGKLLRDHESYGVLTVEGIITHSSNIGAAKVGLKLGPELLYQYMRQFGFGTPTGIPLPGERIGTVHALKDWTKLSITRIPMGHEVAATPLQMIMAMCAIANEGRLMRPMLVTRLEDEEQRVVARFQPQCLRRVCTPEAARLMVTALKTVPATNGTAVKAHLDNYTVAGKTGTAKKANAQGYLDGKYFSSFIGFFPADHPEVCISVVLDEPQVDRGYYGGQTAAPFFKNIAERTANYLNIPPEFLPPQTVAATPAGVLVNPPPN